MPGNDFGGIVGQNEIAARFRHMTAISREEVKGEDIDLKIVN